MQRPAAATPPLGDRVDAGLDSAGDAVVAVGVAGGEETGLSVTEGEAGALEAGEAPPSPSSEQPATAVVNKATAAQATMVRAALCFFAERERERGLRRDEGAERRA
ncbi:hypothetical protein ACFYY2_03860 [Streptomyces sp. NPDC001822]|uniref:hypothetical protein n=1 Tax=Streptomyces sp. NPDC001822 TaxID=3364614 RepID=UPI0036A1E33A